MDKFLATLNKLQDVFTTSGVDSKDIDLPQIVVVGCQSSGKSSVLESIAKQDFLPRGMGIVTRRPLVLQMIQEATEREIDGRKRDTWVKFLHTGEDKIFTDMEEVQREIVNDTEKVCGGDKAISVKPIHVKLHSTKTPSLTLVDLPGLTKIAVGDQPKDIDQRIDKMVRAYIQNKKSIILAVSPGNMDIANSDSLKLAREVDPDGSRTLGVITKCDLMEVSKESRNLLSGDTLAMKLGLVGVINRSNKMLEDRVSANQALALEERYFESNYPEFADRMGTVALGKVLCSVLTSHLKKCLPAVSARISELQEKHRVKLQDLGQENTDPRQSLLTLVMKFTDSIKKSMDGEIAICEEPDDDGKSKGSVKDNTSTSAGAELSKILSRDLIHRLCVIPADQGLSDVKAEIANTSGLQPALYVPDNVFNRLIKKQLAILRNPSLTAIEKCHSCITMSMEKLARVILGKYPRLMVQVSQITRDYLTEQMMKAKEFIEQHITNELSYINTNHPEFVERYNLAGEMFSLTKEEPGNRNNNQYGNDTSAPNNNMVSEFEKHMIRYSHDESMAAKSRTNFEAELILKLIIHYFCIVRGQLCDVITKAVIRYMVHDVSRDLCGVLLKHLYTTDDKIEELVRESEHLQRQRKSSSRMLGALKEAENLVSLIAIGNE